MLRRIAVISAAVLATVGFGLARAGNADAATYVVCGYGVVVPVPGGGSCMSLPDALTAAQATFGPDTIEMLPGTYCPIDLTGSWSGGVAFVGIGIAGLSGSGPIVLNGPEAGLTEFKYDSGFCGSTPSAVVELDVNLASGGFTFQNLTIDGTGVGYGLYDYGYRHTLTLRDAIVQNASSMGIDYLSGCCSTAYDAEIDNSAILTNGTGVQISGYGTVRNSTLAGNTLGVGILNADVSLLNDTISHNQSGVNTGYNGNGVQAVNTIVADNTFANCIVSNDWEQLSPFDNGPGPSSHNLLEGQKEGCPNLDGTDVVVQTLSMPAIGPSGGPTPSIPTSSAATGIGAAPCAFPVDQREFVVTGRTCDDGSVQESANGVPSVSAGSLDLGAVDIGSPSGGAVSLTVTGGDLVGVSSVSISGAGWSISGDGCTFAVMEKAYNSSCSVGVQVQPTSAGKWPGTLAINTTAGTVTAHLHAHTAAPPSISSLLPASGPVGTTVTITGAHFTGATATSFGGVATPSFTVVSDTEITVDVPAGATTGKVAVTTPAGTATSASNFVVVVAPVVHTFSPGQGAAGTTVTITGTHFTGATGVAFHGMPAASFQVVSGTTITAVVPAGATSGRIAVTNAAGTGWSFATFTVVPTPTISSFTPTSGTAGAHVLIHGSGFTGATWVKFNGTPATFTVVSGSIINAVVPVGATSGHITVNAPGGTATSVATFTI